MQERQVALERVQTLSVSLAKTAAYLSSVMWDADNSIDAVMVPVQGSYKQQLRAGLLEKLVWGEGRLNFPYHGPYPVLLTHHLV